MKVLNKKRGMEKSFVFDWQGYADEVYSSLRGKEYDPDLEIYASEAANSQMKEYFEMINDWICNNNFIFSLNGMFNFWNGSRYFDRLIRLEKIEDFIAKLSDTDNLILEYDKKRNILTIKNVHHDGVNIYKIQPLRDLKKKHLKEILLDNVDIEELNDTCNYTYDKPFSKLNKEELFDLFSEFDRIIETI